MKKLEFTLALAKKIGITKDQAEKFLKGQNELIIETLRKDEEVQLTGFGAFKVSKRAARVGVNPRTGEKITIAATRTPKFTAGKTFKESI